MTAMTTAIIGTGGLGSVIARPCRRRRDPAALERRPQIRHSCWRRRSVRPRSSRPVTATRCRAPVPSSWRCGFPCSRASSPRSPTPLAGQLVVVPSNPVGLDAQGNLIHLLPGRAILGRRRSPGGCRPGRAWPWRLAPCRAISSSPLATGHRNRRSCSTRPTTTGRPGSRAADPDGWLRAGEDRRNRPVGPARGGRRPARSRRQPRAGPVIDPRRLMMAGRSTGYVCRCSEQEWKIERHASL